MPRLLTLCFPTYGRLNELHLNSRGDGIVLAPDEFHRMLQESGWAVDVVSFGPETEIPLFRSGLPLRKLSDIDFASYDVYWHMFRDPTQPEVLAILDRLQLDYSGKPVINHVERLRHHVKHRYARVLFDSGMGPEIVSAPPGRSDWLAEESCRVSPDHVYIESNAYNNNRGDYPDRKDEAIVTRYIDNAVDGMRSTVRFGYAYGGGFQGFRYYSRRLAFKSGGAERRELYEVPPHLHSRIEKVLGRLGLDVCHIDAIPIGSELLIVDINPYPTSNGSTLSVITEDLIQQINRRFSGPI